jgi:hypothetical protein
VLTIERRLLSATRLSTVRTSYRIASGTIQILRADPVSSESQCPSEGSFAWWSLLPARPNPRERNHYELVNVDASMVSLDSTTSTVAAHDAKHVHPTYQSEEESWTSFDRCPDSPASVPAEVEPLALVHPTLPSGAVTRCHGPSVQPSSSQRSSETRLAYF